MQLLNLRNQKQLPKNRHVTTECACLNQLKEEENEILPTKTNIFTKDDFQITIDEVPTSKT